MTDGKNGRISLSQIAILEQALDEAPPRNTTDIGKGKAICILAPKIYSLRAKGYAWREIAAWLTERGVSVTAPTLQRYLREEKRAAEQRDKVRPASRKGRTADDRTPAPPRAAGAAFGTGTAMPPEGPRASSLAAPVQAGARTPDRPSFVRRRDTEKI